MQSQIARDLDLILAFVKPRGVDGGALKDDLGIPGGLKHVVAHRGFDLLPIAVAYLVSNRKRGRPDSHIQRGGLDRTIGNFSVTGELTDRNIVVVSRE